MSKFEKTYTELMEMFKDKPTYATGISHLTSTKPQETEATTLDMAKTVARKRRHDMVYIKLHNGKWESIAKYSDIWRDVKFDKYKEMSALIKHNPIKTVISEFIGKYGNNYNQVNDQYEKIKDQFEDYIGKDGKFYNVTVLKNETDEEVSYISIYLIGYLHLVDVDQIGSSDTESKPELGYHIFVSKDSDNINDVKVNYAFDNHDDLIKFANSTKSLNFKSICQKLEKEYSDDGFSDPNN